ncbi:hypothetical protein ES705_45476 [subsurface metagenome]
MKRYKKTFDKSHKVTRILLADYMVLKGYAQQAGVSMAEALHTIITRDWAMARSHKVLTPVTTARSIPVTTARSTPVDIARRGSTPVTTSFSIEVENVTNGHRYSD